MNRVSLVAALLVSIFISACSQPSTPSPTATASAPTASTDTPQPTNTSAPTQPPSPLPTTTPDRPLDAYAGPPPEGALARLGKGRITDLAVSPDGEYLALSTSVGVYLKRLNTFELIWSRPVESWVNDLSFSPDGTKIAAAASDNLIKVWDVETGDTLHVLRGHEVLQDAPLSPSATNDVEVVVFSPDGSLLASGGGVSNIVLWDAATGEKLRTLQKYSAAYDLTFSPDGKHLVSGSRMWDVVTGEEIRRFDYSSNRVAFSLEGDLLAVGTNDEGNNIELWDPVAGERVRTLEGHDEGVLGLAFYPGARLLSYARDHTIVLWDVAAGSRLLAISSDEEYILAPLLTPDGNTILTATTDGRILRWDAGTGEQLPIHTLYGYFSLGLEDIAIHPDGMHLTAGYGGRPWMGHGGLVLVWDIATGDLEHTLMIEDTTISTVAYNPDGTLLMAVGEMGGFITIWDAVTLEQVHTIEVNGPPTGLTFTPDGSTFASLVYDQGVGTWDVATWERLHTINLEDYPPAVPTFSPDGAMIAGGVRGSVYLWDAHTFDVLRVLEGPENEEVGNLTFSPDGRLLAYSYYHDIFVRDVLSDKQIYALEGHEQAGTLIKALAFSPDGRILASSSDDLTIILWDVATGTKLRTLRGHSGWLDCCFGNGGVETLAFISDGRILASGGADGTIVLWPVSP
jgi:WD40 repeat protein